MFRHFSGSFLSSNSLALISRDEMLMVINQTNSWCCLDIFPCQLRFFSENLILATPTAKVHSSLRYFYIGLLLHLTSYFFIFGDNQNDRNINKSYFRVISVLNLHFSWKKTNKIGNMIRIPPRAISRDFGEELSRALPWHTVSPAADAFTCAHSSAIRITFLELIWGVLIACMAHSTRDLVTFLSSLTFMWCSTDSNQ